MYNCVLIGLMLPGGIKRHNFKRGQMTHESKNHRALGSIGAGTTPGRVYPGKKMHGRMGGTQTKIRKLKIIKIDSDLRIVMINGVVPGKPGNLIRITLAKIVGKNIPKSYLHTFILVLIQDGAYYFKHQLYLLLINSK